LPSFFFFSAWIVHEPRRPQPKENCGSERSEAISVCFDEIAASPSGIRNDAEINDFSFYRRSRVSFELLIYT
jgi:hypothetical protein